MSWQYPKTCPHQKKSACIDCLASSETHRCQKEDCDKPAYCCYSYCLNHLTIKTKHYCSHGCKEPNAKCGYCLIQIIREPQPTSERWEGWKVLFREFYDNNENGGSSRWRVAPIVIETYIEQVLEKALFTQKSQLIKEYDKKYNALVEDKVREERESWLNQKANEHNKRIRQSEKERLAEKFGKWKRDNPKANPFIQGYNDALDQVLTILE